MKIKYEIFLDQPMGSNQTIIMSRIGKQPKNKVYVGFYLPAGECLATIDAWRFSKFAKDVAKASGR